MQHIAYIWNERKQDIATRHDGVDVLHLWCTTTLKSRYFISWLLYFAYQHIDNRWLEALSDQPHLIFKNLLQWSFCFKRANHTMRELIGIYRINIIMHWNIFRNSTQWLHPLLSVEVNVIECIYLYITYAATPTSKAFLQSTLLEALLLWKEKIIRDFYQKGYVL